MRTFVATAVTTAATAAFLVAAAAPAAAEDACVRLTAGASSTNTFMSPYGHCEETPYPTRTWSDRYSVGSVGYVEYWIKTP